MLAKAEPEEKKAKFMHECTCSVFALGICNNSRADFAIVMIRISYSEKQINQTKNFSGDEPPISELK